MKKRHWEKILTLAVFTALAGACDSGTEPMDRLVFDAEAALDDYQAMDSVLASEAMASFRALAQGVAFGSFEEEVGFAARVVSEMDLLSGQSGPASFASRIAELASGPGVEAARTPIISTFRRGKTFVYDPALGRYAIDEDREGAPATGVRFVLYQPAPGGKPDPEKEIGYADLIDEGDQSAEEIALRLVVVEGTTTILDYRTTVDVVTDGGTITVDGFIQGQYDRLDFDIQVQGASDGGSAAVDISFEIGIAARDFLISGSVHGAAGDSGEGGDLSLTVRHGADSFSVAATGDEDHIDGTFHLNGDLFATIEGDPDSPTIRGASGADLTWAEMLVLRQIVDSTEDVFDLFEDLLDPVDEMVILALIL